MSITSPTKAAGYDPPMPFVKRFEFLGRSVSKHVTESGVTAYLVDEVPLEALLGLERVLMDQRSRQTQGADDVPDAPDGSRDGPLG